MAGADPGPIRAARLGRDSTRETFAVRVLITPEWYPDAARPYFGVFCREQARAAARAHDVVVLTWRHDPALRAPFRIEQAAEDGFRTFRVRFRGSRIPKSPGAFKLAGIATVLLRLRREGWRPDVIHAHEYVAGRVALLLGRMLRLPVVVSEHYGGFVRNVVPPADRAAAREVFERAAVVCPVSVDLESHLRAIAPSARFETVPNVVDDEVFRPAERHSPGDELRLVAVGNLVDVKGHRFLLEAMPRLGATRKVTLDVIGDGELRPELSALAVRLGVERQVRFLGQRPKPEVAERVRAADVFVLPSLSENMPCALLEALACGVPAVASRVGGVPEVLDESSGVLVEPGSADDLADGVETVAARLDRYDRAATASSARSRYGNDAIARRWSGVYALATGGPGAGA
jgi:glycosyltransferase involved in cell wall biosynthesis